MLKSNTNVKNINYLVIIIKNLFHLTSLPYFEKLLRITYQNELFLAIFYILLF